jgi:hypothetical protein
LPRPIGVAAVVLVALLVDLAFFPDTLEDAFITMRYARHLADGHGVGAWNVGEAPVEGFTNPLWMLLMATAASWGWSLTVTAKTVGILSHAWLCFCFAIWPRIAIDRPAPFGWHPRVTTTTAWLLATYAPLAFYASSGMETATFTALVGMGFVAVAVRGGVGFGSVLAVLLVLMRPEGLFFGVAFGALHWARARSGACRVRLAWMPLAMALATLAGVMISRQLVFGEWAPNTYHAKVAGALGLHLRLGVRYVVSWGIAHAVWVMLALWAAWRLRERMSLRALYAGTECICCRCGAAWWR